MEDNREMPIEEILERLQEITASLEDGELSLEESFKAYEDGMKLIKKASDIIDNVEKKIVILQEEGSGTEE